MAETPAARRWWRHAIVVLAGFEAAAVAIWLIPASIHVVDWPASGPSRVALFASQVRLISLAGVGLFLAALALWVVKSRDGSARLAAAAAPMCLLWLWAVPYLPWLPQRMPLLLLFGGPLRWVVGAVVLAAIIAGVGRFSRPLSIVPGNGRRLRWLLFAASLTLYSGCGLLNARSVGPGGDEPHYLIISQSLLADGDLKIEDNHRRREFRSFWGGELRPDYMKRGIDGEIYSIHAPGLPAILLPVYAVAGYPGTVLAVSLTAAFTALAIFDLAAAVAGVSAGLLAWAAVCLTVPFVPHGWLVFPEMPGALIVALAALWTFAPIDDRIGRWIWRGSMLAVLPWLHTKFVIFLAVFVAALAWRARQHFRILAALAAPAALSIAAWLYFFYAFYGTINPEAPYGDYPALNVLAKNIPRGLLGLMFDQKFGLFFYSPIYLFAAAGAWLMLKRPDTRLLGAVLLLATALHVGSTTRLYMWWGGTSAPARFLVPILPCLAAMIALQAAALGARAGRTFFGACLLASLLVAAAGTAAPARLFLFSDSRGYARLLEAIQAGAPLTFLLPTFTYEDWVSPIRVLVPWLLAGGLSVAAVLGAARWLRLGPIWLASLAGLTLLLAADVLASRPDSEAREELARRGALDLIWQYDDRLRPFEYDTLRKIDETRLREVSHVRFRRYPIPGLALPEGTYEARVWFAGALQRQGEIAVSSAQRVTFARAAGLLANPAVIPFALPVEVGRLTVNVSDQSAAASVARTEIVPTVMSSRGARQQRPPRRVEEVAHRAGAYLVYLDDHAYPEGGVFWTRSTERTEVLVAPGEHSRIRLTFHLGPRSGEVELTASGAAKTIRVEAGGSAEVQLNVPSGAHLLPIGVRSPTTFRPSTEDPTSDDGQSLGVQVRVDVD